MMPGGKRRPSFKMVSNMVIQLLHSIKYSVEVPFSNMAQQPMEIQKTAVSKKVPSRLKERERERKSGGGISGSRSSSTIYQLKYFVYSYLISSILFLFLLLPIPPV